MHAAKAAKRAAGESAGKTAEEAPAGGEALRALHAVLRAKDAPHAAVVAAARALLDAEAGAEVAKPTTVSAVQGLSTAELHRLVGRLEAARTLPPLLEAPPVQG